MAQKYRRAVPFTRSSTRRGIQTTAPDGIALASIGMRDMRS